MLELIAKVNSDYMIISSVYVDD